MALRILVSPLDWGLGHATRCIPIIRHLLDKNCEVVIAADGAPLALLREEFPQLEYVELRGYRVWYSSIFSATVSVAMQVGKINRAIAREHRELQTIIESKKIDAVISDNRYGLYSDKVPCVLMTHQLNIQSPFVKGKLREKNVAHIKKFNECWVPDYEDGDTLSCSLAHPVPEGINATYIGILSRFESRPDRKEMQYDLLVLLSGPEPQRTILEKKAIKQINEIGNIKALIVRGMPGGKSFTVNENIEVVPHMDKNALLEKILVSKAILARPGYSTLMDLAVIGGKRAIFIPTPGQTEQEYLGMYMESEEIGVLSLQKNFSLKETWRRVFQSKGFNNKLYKEIYKDKIDGWLRTAPKP
jgi:uncharacterized protein (TIGR00661 family)